MSIEVTVDHDNQVVIARCDSEKLTIAHLHDYLRVWDENVKNYDELFIMNEADLSQLSFTELLRQATEAVRLDAKGSLVARNARVVDCEMGKQLAEYFEAAKILAGDQIREGRVFTDEADARAWLNERKG